MVLSLEIGSARNTFAMPVVVNVTFWVDVESHKAWFSVAKLPHITILLFALQVLLAPASFIW
eukprot:8455807-Prorocentrum_lima.AAC.1